MGADALQIRFEKDEDREAIAAVHRSAFDTPAEAQLVAALRGQAAPIVSLVAERGNAIVGHILLTPVELAGRPDLKIMGLAPMAVLPRHQRQGIGSALVRAGLEECRRLGFGAVVVLGHAEYYPRFGFVPAARFGMGCQYDVPEEAFMAIELAAGYLSGASGKVRYHTAFDSV